MIDLGLTGKRLQSMQLEYTLVLQLSDVYFIAVSSPLVVESGDSRTSLSPEEDSEDAFAPIRNLVGRAVETAIAGPSGDLDVTFEGGTRVYVEPHPSFEAWNVSGPDGALVVSMPGGELAIWSAWSGGGER